MKQHSLDPRLDSHLDRLNKNVEDWLDAANWIQDCLKNEIQTDRGFLAHLKREYLDAELQAKSEENTSALVKAIEEAQKALKDQAEVMGTSGVTPNHDFDGYSSREDIDLDDLYDHTTKRIEQLKTHDDYDGLVEGLLNEIKTINMDRQARVELELLNKLYSRKRLDSSWPNLSRTQQALKDKRAGRTKLDSTGKRRLTGVLSSLAAMKRIQGNRANAGKAAEIAVQTLLESQGENFTAQHPVDNGTVIDFVVPKVEPRKKKQVKASIAVQMSTNDRLKMAVTELMTLNNGDKYFWTGNGMTASSKALKDIADEPLMQFRDHSIDIALHSRVLREELENGIGKKLKDLHEKKEELKKIVDDEEKETLDKNINDVEESLSSNSNSAVLDRHEEKETLKENIRDLEDSLLSSPNSAVLDRHITFLQNGISFYEFTFKLQDLMNR